MYRIAVLFELHLFTKGIGSPYPILSLTEGFVGIIKDIDNANFQRLPGSLTYSVKNINTWDLGFVVNPDMFYIMYPV